MTTAHRDPDPDPDRDSDHDHGPAAPPALELAGVCVRLGGRQVLDHVSFAIARGEFTGLIGSNGAGKTTMLRIVMGLRAADEGAVRVDGRARTRRGRKIGYVPQKIAIEPDAPLRARDLVGLGVFTVLRGQSFAGHALSDLGTLGGSGAFLLGLAPLWGFIGAGVAVGGAMDLSGSERRSARDVSTGIVLGAVLGVSALLLYFDTTWHSTTGVTVTVLFGSLFSVAGYTVPATLAFAALGLGVLALAYRPLLLSAVGAEIAAARGVRVRLLGFVFLVTMGSPSRSPP